MGNDYDQLGEQLPTVSYNSSHTQAHTHTLTVVEAYIQDCRIQPLPQSKFAYDHHVQIADYILPKIIRFNLNLPIHGIFIH